MCDPITAAIAIGATAAVGGTGYAVYQGEQQKGATKKANKKRAADKAVLDEERKKAEKTKQSDAIKSAALQKRKSASLLSGGRRDTMLTGAATLGSTGVQGKTLLGQ